MKIRKTSYEIDPPSPYWWYKRKLIDLDQWDKKGCFSNVRRFYNVNKAFNAFMTCPADTIMRRYVMHGKKWYLDHEWIKL